MTAPDVARIIGEMSKRDDPVALEQLRLELARLWPGDHDAEVLARTIETKIRRPQRAN